MFHCLSAHYIFLFHINQYWLQYCIMQDITCIITNFDIYIYNTLLYPDIGLVGIYYIHRVTDQRVKFINIKRILIIRFNNTLPTMLMITIISRYTITWCMRLLQYIKRQLINTNITLIIKSFSLVF